MQFNPSDIGYNNGDGFGPSNRVFNSHVMSDGKILICGSISKYNSTPISAIFRLLPNGLIDTTFQHVSINNTINAIGIQSNNKIVIVGSFTHIDGVFQTGIARLLPNGNLDTSFASIIDVPSIDKLSILSDDRIIVGGDFTHYNGTAVNRLARLNPGGSLDTSFNIGSGFSDRVHTLVVQADDKVVVAGEFDFVNNFYHNKIVRLQPNGSIDTTFISGTGFLGAVFDLAIDNSNMIIAAGNLQQYDGTNVAPIVRLQSNGNLDQQYPGPNIASLVSEIDAQPNGGIIYYATYSSSSPITYDRYIGRLDQNGLDDINFNSPFLFDLNDTNSDVRCLTTLNNGKILLGGEWLNNYSMLGYHSLIRLESNGTIDTTFNAGTGFNEEIRVCQISSNGNIILGGSFSKVNGTPRSSIALLNLNGSLDQSFSPDLIYDESSGVYGTVLSIAEQSDGKFLIGGQFRNVGNEERISFARLNTDGTIDLSFNPPSLGILHHAISLQADGKIITYSSGGLSRHFLDGSLDTSFMVGAGPDGTVKEIIVLDDDRILIAGSFTSYDGIPINDIALLNVDGSLHSTFNPGDGADNFINAMRVQSDGKILIGGSFTMVDGTGRNYIARISEDGSLDTTFDPGQGANFPINSIDVQEDGKIVIAGLFTSINGVGRSRLARLNIDGTLDISFDPGNGADSRINSLAIQGDGQVLIGGDFVSYDGVGRNRLARVNVESDVTVTSLSSVGTYCEGDPLDVGYTTTGSFNLGNIFTIELSDEYGSFSVPTVIGSLSALASGTINCSLPVGAATGSEYRIRIIASDPPITGSDNGLDLMIISGQTWYADTDSDGLGDPAVDSVSCTQPASFVANHLDCDPTTSASSTCDDGDPGTLGDVNNAECACSGTPPPSTECSALEWDVRFGGTDNDNGSVLIPAGDGYLIGASTRSPVSGDLSAPAQGEFDYLMIRTDGSGNELWEKRYGGAAGDNLTSIAKTADGGFLLAGSSFSGVSGDRTTPSRGGQDYWVLQVDSLGAVLWDKVFGGSDYDQLESAFATPDGGFLLAGRSASGAGGEKTDPSQGAMDYWVVRIDSTGKKVWDAAYGGPDVEFLADAAPTLDGGVILAGYTDSDAGGDIAQASQGGFDAWLVRLNASGALVWEKRFGGSGDDEAYAVKALPDGGFLVGASSTSPADGDKTAAPQGGYDIWMLRLDALGNILWDAGLGGSGADQLDDLSILPDGNYMLHGWSNSDISGDKSEDSRGGYDYWSVRTDVLGNRVWDRTVGGTDNDFLIAAIGNSDSTQVLIGHSTSGVGGEHSQGNWGGTDIWMTKLALNTGTSWYADLDGDGLGDAATDSLACEQPDGYVANADDCNDQVTATTLCDDGDAATLGDVNYADCACTGILPPVTECIDLVWDRRFGGTGSDLGRVVVPAGTNGFLFGGSSTSGISGDKTQASQGGDDFWIVRTDSLGVQVWDARYGGSGNDQLNDIVELPDGGFLLAGRSASGIGGDKTQASRGGYDYWVVRIDSSGNKAWDKRFGGSADETLSHAMLMDNGEVLLAGRSASGSTGDRSEASQGGTDYWIVRMDSLGNKLWDARFGGPANDDLYAAARTVNDGVILTGYSASGSGGDKSEASQGGFDIWTVLVDKAGNKQWDRTHGGSGNDEAYGVIETADGGFLLGGSSDSPISGDKTQASQGGYDFWLVRTDGAGNTLWDRRYGGAGSDNMDDLARTPDGNYLIYGWSNSDATGDKTENGRGGYDFWMVRVDAEGGQVWDRTYGGDANDFLQTGISQSDGGQMLIGYSQSGVSGEHSQGNWGGNDLWALRVTTLPELTWYVDSDQDGYGDPAVDSVSCTQPSGYVLDQSDCNDALNTVYVGAACDDGDSNTTNDIIGPNCTCIGESAAINASIRVFLEGPYDDATGLMHDSLRVQAEIPHTEPYSALGYSFVNGGGESVDPSLLAVTGTDAIVDWVIVELRHPQNNSIIESHSALLQRDGDVVGNDGATQITFDQPAGLYSILVRHRNHLGVMVSPPVALAGSPVLIDFTDPAVTTYGNSGSRKHINGTSVLWAGDVNFDKFIKYTGSGNDRDVILQGIGGVVPTAVQPGYRQEDVNMDGTVKYTGSGNDRDPVLQNIGGTVPTNVKNAQTP